MSNSSSSTGGDNESSPNPSPNPNPSPPHREQSPRQRRGGANAPASHQGRGGPSSAPPRTSRPLAFTPPPWPPIMGIPGQSAFTPYTRPTQPHWPAPGSSGGPSGSGFGFMGGYGFHGPQSLPVGGSGYGGVAAAGALRIGGSPAARKRVRDGGADGAAAAGGNQQGDGGNPINCSVCGKSFNSSKALFGHMRSHPDRGWKGAHPPPTFRAQEEFADLPGLNRPEAAATATAGAGAAAAAGEAKEGADVGGGERMDMEAQGAEEAGEPRNYRVPDLNNSPPSDSKE